ncbi:MAG: hypothetical protein J7L66_06270, partial [Anaerolineaceae bacterium]|nr:hypothetical protein [Anaerolineaceae bacterium]
MIKESNRLIFLFFMIAGLIFFAACGGAPPAETNEENQKSSEEKVPEIVPETDESVSPDEEKEAALSSDPQKIKFSTSDGIELNSVY